MKVSGACEEIGSDSSEIFWWILQYEWGRWAANHTARLGVFTYQNMRWLACHSHRCKCCSHLSKATRVNISSISVPWQIKASLLRAFGAKTENHVNLLVTHSILLTYTRHVIYLLYNYFYFYRYVQASGLAGSFHSWLLLGGCTFKRALAFRRMAVNKGLNVFGVFNWRSISIQDSNVRKTSISMWACAASPKPFYPTTIRHSRSQKLMADLLHCRSPSFIAINPFSLPAKIYSGPFCILFLSLFFPTPDSTICLSSLTYRFLLPPDSFPKLPSPFKQHQTTPDAFASAENVQTDGRFVKRRHCEIQRRLPGGDWLVRQCVVRQSRSYTRTAAHISWEAHISQNLVPWDVWKLYLQSFLFGRLL